MRSYGLLGGAPVFDILDPFVPQPDPLIHQAYAQRAADPASPPPSRIWRTVVPPVYVSTASAMPDTPELTQADIARLVDRFYDKVQRNPSLGPVFNPAVHDWAEHKATLVAFWSSITLKTGQYRGNPMARHRPHAIEVEHFDDWLTLWKETAHEVLPAAHATLFDEHARRIARSLIYGLGLDPLRKPLGIPVVPRVDGEPQA